MNLFKNIYGLTAMEEKTVLKILSKYFKYLSILVLIILTTKIIGKKSYLTKSQQFSS